MMGLESPGSAPLNTEHSPKGVPTLPVDVTVDDWALILRTFLQFSSRWKAGVCISEPAALVGYRAALRRSPPLCAALGSLGSERAHRSPVPTGLFSCVCFSRLFSSRFLGGGSWERPPLALGGEKCLSPSRSEVLLSAWTMLGPCSFL